MRFLLQKSDTAALLVAALLMTSHSASAQHSDIEFSYEANKIAVEFGDEGSVFESDIPTSGIEEQFTVNPGFASEVEEGLGITPGHVVDYNILGALKYHDGTSFASVPSGAKIVIDDNPTGSLEVDESTVGPVTGGGFIGQADAGGDVHTHIDFTLAPQSLDTAEYGAYGVLMSLSSYEDDGTTPTGIADSDPFYVVFNFGLDEPVFEEAVGAFAAQVPEPTSLALIGTAGLFGLVRRRRKSRRRRE